MADSNRRKLVKTIEYNGIKADIYLIKGERGEFASVDVFRPYTWVNPETGKAQPGKGCSYTLNGQSKSLKEILDRAEMWDQGRRAQKKQSDTVEAPVVTPEVEVVTPEEKAA